MLPFHLPVVSSCFASSFCTYVTNHPHELADDDDEDRGRGKPSDPPGGRLPPSKPPTQFGFGHFGDEDAGTEAFDQANASTRDGGPTLNRCSAIGPFRQGATIRGHHLKQLIGRGATSLVFKAIELERKRPVALKVLDNRDADRLARFKNGYRALAEINDPHLVRMHGLYAHADDNQTFITMELIDGLALPIALRNEGFRQPAAFYQRLRELLQHASRALHCLHMRQYVHRDIKPNNLMIDAQGRLRLIDYGLVTSFGSIRDQNIDRRYLVGTRPYMAPEVLAKQVYLPASDIFSLGRVFLKVVRSLHPYIVDPTVSRVQLSRHLNVPADIPRDLCDLLQWMLARNPSDRPTAWEITSSVESDQPAMTTGYINTDLLGLQGRDPQIEKVQRWLLDVCDGKACRLHISAPPGMGKTRLLAEIEELLSRPGWTQVFASRCRRREDVPLQAFDEMIDRLTRRYGGIAAGQLELDPTSSQILASSFPSLRKVLQRAAHVASELSAGYSQARHAAIQLTKQVARHGPVVLMIDDLQWADRDSLALIRQLQEAVVGHVGIITASRDNFTPTHVSPADILTLDPLSEPTATELLRVHLRAHRLTLAEDQVASLARFAGGSPLVVTQLARLLAGLSESERGDWLASQPDSLHALWKRHYEKLAAASRSFLTAVLTCGGPCDTTTAAEVAGIPAAAADDLADSLERTDWISKANATHEVEIVQQNIVDFLKSHLPSEELCRMHRSWAIRLQAAPRRFVAARVAGHLLAAGDQDQALGFAIEAAAQARQRFAPDEQARWHREVSRIARSTAQRFEHLRQAADAYSLAGQSSEAAELYQRLAASKDYDDAQACRGLAAESFIRADRWKEAREEIAALAASVNLPVPRARWRSQIRAAWNLIRLQRRGGYNYHPPTETDPAEALRARVCFRLAQTLSMFDNDYAAELSTVGMLQIRRFATCSDAVHAAAASAVFGSYDKGWWRQRSKPLLRQLAREAEASGEPEALAHVASGEAYFAWLTGQLAESIALCSEAADRYRRDCQGCIFESVHVQVPLFTSYFFTGRFEELFALTRSVAEDGSRRGCRFTKRISRTGFAAASRLMLNDLPAVRQTLHRESQLHSTKGYFEYLDFSRLMASGLWKLYVGRPDHARRMLLLWEPRLKRSNLARAQLLRICWNWMLVTAHLQSLPTSDGLPEADVAALKNRTRRLDAEENPFAVLLADFLNGQISERQGFTESATSFFGRAATAADQQQLEPFRLAACDGLERLGKRSSKTPRLMDYLAQAKVHDPERCLRLYIAP